jgi:L-lactate dehydrogenase complex protein LldG
MSHPLLTGLRARVRQAVARATLPDHAPAHPGRFAWESHDDATADDRVARFTRELEPLGGTVQRVPSTDAAGDAVLSLVSQHGRDGVLTWDEVAIGVPGLLERLQGAGVRLVAQDVSDGPGREQRVGELGACSVGITGAEFGLADTGSLVVVSGRGRGRLASLLPPVHVAVLPVSQLVWTLADALAMQPTLATSGSNLVVITGPSRTADIEMTLTRGVHGPRDVHVILVG